MNTATATSATTPTATSVAPIDIARSRMVERLVRGQPTSDGDGVKLTRILTQPLQRRLDPFLMLDAFGSDTASDYIGGFPDHPHRGFETVTLMLEGRMRHRDSVGNVGLLEPGSVQWMTAARGIIHSEMPEQQQGRMAGFQLWVNLAAKDKLGAPAYRDIAPDQVPTIELGDGVTARIIAGSSHGVDGAVSRPTTEPLVLDISLPPGSRLTQPIPPGHNAFLYVHGSAVSIEADRRFDVSNAVEPGQMAILTNDAQAEGVIIGVPADATQTARVLLVAGQPLNEPIAQYGPFVMNTQAEIAQAMADFRDGKLAA